MNSSATLCSFFLRCGLIVNSMLIGCQPQPKSPAPAPKSLFPTSTATTKPTSRPSTHPESLGISNNLPDVFPVTSDPRQTLPYLASDALGGRLPGTPGLQRAGDFLASELSRIGLKPVPGQADYFQAFSMSESSSLAPSTHLALNGQNLLVTKDYSPLSICAEKAFSGKVVFAGFGITRKDSEHYDDYTGIDAQGKVVLALMKEPLDAKGASRFAQGRSQWSSSALFISKAQNAAKHGAVALLLVSPPASGGGDLLNGYSGDGSNQTTIPVIQVTRRVANLLLSMGGAADLKTLSESINTSFSPRSTPLPELDIAGAVAVAHSQLPVRNVMAYLPGAGPSADEWVVVGAHYDHLGRGQLGHMMGGKVGTIWHGADDNASGTAAVLELAEKLKSSPPLPRSVLFVFFTGEEEGLIGSDHFVRNPPIDLGKVVAMLNMDMVGRLRGNALQIGGAGTARNWDTVVASAVAGTGITTSTALPDDGGRGGMGPSDHMSFAEHKIPVLFLFTGMHADYHRPSDTADKINYDGIDTLVGVAQRIVQQMTFMTRQTYDASSDNNAMAGMLPGGKGHRAVLGIIPDDSAAETTTGVRISGVMPGGPAEIAGLKAGDTIVALNGKPMKTLGDLSQLLDESHGGDKVLVKVMRGLTAVELKATLTERK